MFHILLESLPESRGPQPRWGAGLALLLHGAVVGALLRPPAPAAAPPPVILVDWSGSATPVRESPQPSHGVDLRIPETPPLRLPRVVLPEIPEAAAPGGRAAATTPSVGTSPGGRGGEDPVAASLVQEAPELLSAPPPVYPAELRDAGVEGTVVLRLVVDTLGRVEVGTVQVVRADHEGLVGPAARSLRLARFRPARMYGRAVRVLVEVPVRFRLRR